MFSLLRVHRDEETKYKTKQNEGRVGLIKAIKVNLNCEKQLSLSPTQIIDSFLAPQLALNYASTF